MAIRIITDSSSDLQPAAAAAMGVSIIPLSIQMGDVTYWDGQTIDRDTFYTMLQSSQQLPTTSQPTPDAFLQQFQQAKDAGDQVVAVLLSGALSGTVQSAMIARELCQYDDIHIVDSRSATAGIQLLLHQACLMRDGGSSAPEITAALEDLKHRVRIFAVVDTLEYLRRGGRLSDLAANIGAVTKLKPTITVRDGAVSIVGKSFGSAAATKHLLKLLQEHPADSRYPLHLVFTDDAANSAPLAAKMTELGMFPSQPLYSGVGPAIGTHVGPGAFGAAYIEAL